MYKMLPLDVVHIIESFMFIHYDDIDEYRNVEVDLNGVLSDMRSIILVFYDGFASELKRTYDVLLWKFAAHEFNIKNKSHYTTNNKLCGWCCRDMQRYYVYMVDAGYHIYNNNKKYMITEFYCKECSQKVVYAINNFTNKRGFNFGRLIDDFNEKIKGDVVFPKLYPILSETSPSVERIEK